MIALLRMNAGLILWAVGFSLIYAVHGVGCAAAASWVGPVMRTIWLMILGLHVALLLWLYRVDRGTGLDRIGVWTAVAGAGATLITGLPVALPTSCL